MPLLTGVLVKVSERVQPSHQLPRSVPRTGCLRFHQTVPLKHIGKGKICVKSTLRHTWAVPHEGGDVFSLQLTNVVDFSTAKPDTRRVERPITVGVGRERVGVREENESDKGGGVQ